MFTQLVFNINKKEITFDSHEIIKIVERLVILSEEEKVAIPSFDSFDEYFKSQTLGKNIIDLVSHSDTVENFIKEPLNQYLLIPAHIGEVNNIKKWLYLAKNLSSIKSEAQERGLWINLADRLLLVKLEYRALLSLCLSDKKQTIKKRKRKLRNSTDFSMRERFLLYKKNENWILYAQNFKDQVATHDITNIVKQHIKKENLKHENFPQYREAILKDILHKRLLGHSQPFYVSDHGNITELARAAFDAMFGTSDLALDLITHEILRKKLVGQDVNEFKKKIASLLGFDESSEEFISIWKTLNAQSDFTQVIKDSLKYLIENSKKFAYITDSVIPDNLWQKIIRYFIACRVAYELHFGKHEKLFRPLSSYGEKHKGNSYREFRQSIDSYFQKPDCLSQDELAKKVREILSAGIIEDDELAFLPNLVGVWFLVEPARNPLALAAGLMLLDMLENKVMLFDRGLNDLYCWEYALIHPYKNPKIKQDDKEEMVVDLYGAPVSIDKFDGSHPMCHLGSAESDLKTPLANGEKLTPVRQKEGSLFIHWLYNFINEKKSKRQSEHKLNFSLSLKRAEEFPLQFKKGGKSDSAIPNYEQIQANTVFDDLIKIIKILESNEKLTDKNKKILIDNYMEVIQITPDLDGEVLKKLKAEAELSVAEIEALYDLSLKNGALEKLKAGLELSVAKKQISRDALKKLEAEAELSVAEIEALYALSLSVAEIRVLRNICKKLIECKAEILLNKAQKEIQKLEKKANLFEDEEKKLRDNYKLLIQLSVLEPAIKQRLSTLENLLIPQATPQEHSYPSAGAVFKHIMEVAAEPLKYNQLEQIIENLQTAPDEYRKLINNSDAQNNNPLKIAVRASNVEGAKLLLESGAVPDQETIALINDNSGFKEKVEHLLSASSAATEPLQWTSNTSFFPSKNKITPIVTEPGSSKKEAGASC